MKRKIFLTLALTLLMLCFFTISILAEEVETVVIESGSYYLYSENGGASPFLLYSSYEYFESDSADGSRDDFIAILYADDFSNFVDEMENRYNNNVDGGKDNYSTFEDYFMSGFGNSSERFKNNVKKQVEIILKAKAVEDSDQSGSGDTGVGGGNESEDGSSSSGSQNGEPNVTIDQTVDMSGMGSCYCSGIETHQCDCYELGYSWGWSAALGSEAVKNALQEAFDQGFREVNTDSWHEMIANEKEEAVNEYKISEEFQNEISEAKNTAIKEYRQSDKYVEDFTSEENSEEEQRKIEQIKNQIIEEFKESPEQIEIIGQAKEGAKSEFVVEMDSILKGDRQPATEQEEGMKVLVEEKIRVEREDAVNDFASELDEIMSGESEPVEGSPGESVVQNIVQTIALSYQEGLEAGEADFKLSIEYKTSLETEYKAGSEAGYQQGFLIGTNDGYSKGLLDGAELANEELYNKGKNEYINTKAYQDTLQETYDQGYADGSEGDTFNPLSYIIPVIVLCALLAGYFIISSKLKKKKSKN